MHIDFKAPTIDLTDDIRGYTEEKVAMVTKLLQSVDEENISAEVELAQSSEHQTGNIYRADVTIHAGAQRTHAVGHGESLQAAIDEAKDELSRRLRRGKTKRLDALRAGGAQIKKMLRFWE